MFCTFYINNKQIYMEPNHFEPEANNEQSNSQINQTTVTNSTSESTNAKSSFDFSEINIMAALSYVGPLVIIPFLTHRENPYVLFHIKQGLVLLAIALVLHVSTFILFFLLPFIMLINLGLFILSIIGIINALQHKEKDVPITGKFASHIKL